MVAKEVEKILRGGNHTAIIRVPAEVCLKCGDRLYSRETVFVSSKSASSWNARKPKNFDPWASLSRCCESPLQEERAEAFDCRNDV